MSEAFRIADQLRRAFEGEAWHGDSLLELLQDVTAPKASAHPVKGAHSIWELVLHITAWDAAVNRRIVSGKVLTLPDEENFPPVKDTSEDAWKRALTNLEKVHEELVQTALNLPDSRLHERVAGKDYDTYFMLHGVTQHELYHAGQIAILKRGS